MFFIDDVDMEYASTITPIKETSVKIRFKIILDLMVLNIVESCR